MTVLILILLVSIVTIFGAIYARRRNSPDGLVALYVIFCAMSQILAAKIALFDFGFISVTAPAAVLIFAVTFLITDIVNEKFGRAATHRMIFVTLATQIALVLFVWMASTGLPPAPFWKGQDAWDSVFGLIPRIVFASWVTFLISENLDAWLFDVFFQWTKGKHLWARNAFSTIPSLTVDTLLFVTLAFAGTDIPLGPVMIGQFVAKYVVAIINIPFMYINRMFLGETRTLNAN
ncbi:MAG: queuosine precursor transporter [Gammaproteobacteria bacterium]